MSQCITKTCTLMDRIGKLFQSPLLLVLRLYWGWQFVLAGYGKLMHPADVAPFFEALAIPFPYFNVFLVGFIEFFGGILLLVGLASRIVVIPLIITMIVAYATAHREALMGIFKNPDLFFQQSPFLFLYATLVVFAFGPGKFSLDYLFGCIKK